MDGLIFGTTANAISSGGTINGSLTIDGDLTVDGDLLVKGDKIDFTDIPTSDPGIAGRLWNSSGDLKISTG